MRIILLLIACAIPNLIFAQRSETEMQRRLLEIGQAEEEASVKRQERVEKYAREHGVDIWQNDGLNTIMLYDVLGNGHPVFITTHNAGAAVTTGAAVLKNKEDFGIQLSGDGVSVGVWDGGRTRIEHQEFTNNIRTADGAANNNFHATHVTGTIKASGVNPEAEGMAINSFVRTYDWNSDTQEMTEASTADDSGILLSNHSYGAIGGWDRGVWHGDASISDQEDWKFGFYNSGAANVDAISYNAPYYLIAWAAGNDRGDSGDGSHPTDGPYDIITWTGNAKNILTVGAVNKIGAGYQRPEDVVMSSFSSWGPTDDGRIKPDIVGAGVGILSTFEKADDDYGRISGTSMATPNVVGTLALLQEMNKKLYGRYMKSAMIKGLAIHTAHEAGRADGPDYEFGWGLLNAEGAANMLLSRNKTNRIVENHILQDGEPYNLTLNPIEGSEVKVTICWTDLPGSPTSVQLDPTDLMLVNDLDMRISNDSETHMPYILNPSAPSLAATTGDNFRDNVEKIEFVADGNPYELTINHKGSLETGAQEFSLIVSYESEAASQVFYYVGGSAGNWSDIESFLPANGNRTAARLPGKDDVVIIDNESFAVDGNEANTEEELVFALKESIEVGSLLIFSDGVIIDLNGNNITINNNISTALGDMKFTGEGSIILKSNDGVEHSMEGKKDSYTEVDVLVDYENGSSLLLSNKLALNTLNIINGRVTLSEAKNTFSSIRIDNQAVFDVTNSEITMTGNLSVAEGASLNMVSSELNFNDGAEIDANGSLISSKTFVKAGSISVLSDASFNDLTLNALSEVKINDGVTVEVKDKFLTKGVEVGPVSMSSDGTASLQYAKNELLCFDYLNIDGVNAVGDGAFNVGLHGSAINATGWQSLPCADVVFSNFTYGKVCEGGVELFTAEANGSSLKYEWFVNDGMVSDLDNTYIEFADQSNTEVKLTVTNAEGVSDSYAVNVTPSANTLQANELLYNGTQLVSRVPGETYQWFKDGLPLEGETNRTLLLSGGEGNFYVVVSDGSCTRKSDEYSFRITSAEDDLFESEYSIYPNPAGDVVNIAVESAFAGKVAIRMTEMSGREIYVSTMDKNTFQLNESINTSGLPDGLYVITIIQGENKVSKLVGIRQ